MLPKGECMFFRYSAIGCSLPNSMLSVEGGGAPNVDAAFYKLLNAIGDMWEDLLS